MGAYKHNTRVIKISRIKKKMRGDKGKGKEKNRPLNSHSSSFKEGEEGETG